MDEERTSANSSRSSSRAKETSELVQKTLEDAMQLKETFEKGGESCRDSESNFETEESSSRGKQINVDDI